MPPRIPISTGLQSLTLCLRPVKQQPSLLRQPIIQTAGIKVLGRLKARRRKARLDPYWWAQYEQRKNANLKRQDELQTDRDAKLGTPIHGVPTPFTHSFDVAGQLEELPRPELEDGEEIDPTDVAATIKAATTPQTPLEPLPTSPHILNYLVDKSELEEAIKDTYALTKPMEHPHQDPQERDSLAARHEARHNNAIEALHRMMDLMNGSSRDRLHANIRRCVETFGRHNTDATFRQKPKGVGAPEVPAEFIRGGPDTGSSEVQIAILTAKIRKLAQMWEGRKGDKDKANKRNLRLLLHRRQKLLKYMERRERGSERWTHMLETLGLTPANWKGQIAVEYKRAEE